MKSIKWILLFCLLHCRFVFSSDLFLDDISPSCSGSEGDVEFLTGKNSFPTPRACCRKRRASFGDHSTWVERERIIEQNRQFALRSFHLAKNLGNEEFYHGCFPGLFACCFGSINKRRFLFEIVDHIKILNNQRQFACSELERESQNSSEGVPTESAGSAEILRSLIVAGEKIMLEVQKNREALEALIGTMPQIKEQEGTLSIEVLRENLRRRLSRGEKQ